VSAAGGTILIELGWPAKQLSPNARVHHMVKHRYAKAAKIEAGWATKAAQPRDFGGDRFDIHIRAYPPVNRNRDADNLIASMKAHLDGIAGALEVNDSLFNAPTLEWADVTEHGKVVVTVKPA
jgi:crossover junction endodeoxyribonuclease RusA